MCVDLDPAPVTQGKLPGGPAAPLVALRARVARRAGRGHRSSLPYVGLPDSRAPCGHAEGRGPFRSYGVGVGGGPLLRASCPRQRVRGRPAVEPLVGLAAQLLAGQERVVAGVG